MDKIQLLHDLQGACAFIYSHRDEFTNWLLIEPDDFIEKLTFLYDNAGSQIRSKFFELGSEII